MVVRERYLLTTLLSEIANGSASRPKMSEEVIFRARYYVLQIAAPVGFNVLDIWPAANFDGEYQIFFLSVVWPTETFAQSSSG